MCLLLLLLYHYCYNFFFFFFNDTATTEIYTLPYTTLFRSEGAERAGQEGGRGADHQRDDVLPRRAPLRSEEHTSELQSQSNLVCRLLLEKKKKQYITDYSAITNKYTSTTTFIPGLTLPHHH